MILEHGELITAVDLPALPIARKTVYLKVRDRTSYSTSLMRVFRSRISFKINVTTASSANSTAAE